MPDQIKQWELMAASHLEIAKDALFLDFARRLDAGATVEPGGYSIERDTSTTLQELELRGGVECSISQIGLSLEPPEIPENGTVA